MKYILFLALISTHQPCRADSFTLKDGARLEGEVTGETEDAMLVSTKYGSLTIKKEDILERKEAGQAAEPAAVSSAAPAALDISTAAAALQAEPPRGLTFLTVVTGTAARQLVYLDEGVAIATETVDASGAQLSLDGTIKDGTYTEYYPDGELKTVKTMLAGRINGTLKAFYPGGGAQVEAYYLAGGKDGLFRYYTEGGALLMEASYKNDLLNGWKREYGPDGAVASEIFYVDDKPGEPPKQAAAPAAETPAEPVSIVTVSSTRLARGERFSFKSNDKFIGKLQLDKAYNLMRKEGKIPDGTVKAYSREGVLEKEFVFEGNNLKLLRVYGQSGAPSEYAYEKDKAVKK